MTNKYILLSILVLVSLKTFECGRFGGGRSSGGGWGRSSGRSSWGKSSGSSWGKWGSSRSSSSIWNKPSYSKPSYSKPSYPSSSSGLSEHGKSSNSHPSYPSSSSGLSGYGKPSYPSSSSGLSGYGKPSYPSSSSGLSGNGKQSYPSSSSGLSGHGKPSHSQPSYPTSSTGLSGSHGGSSNSYGYPNSPGFSGSSSGSRKPTDHKDQYHNNHHYSNTNNHYYGNHGSYVPPYQGHGVNYNIPTYYAAPQHVYVTEYRHSGSPYSDLLTGLALYNLGRSHSHYDHHYYYDDYYRQRYHSPSSNYNYDRTSENVPKEEARCVLRIKEEGKEQQLKVPCEIVSTFTEGSKKVETNEFEKTISCLANETNNINEPTTTTTTMKPTTTTQKRNLTIFEELDEFKHADMLSADDIFERANKIMKRIQNERVWLPTTASPTTSNDTATTDQINSTTTIKPVLLNSTEHNNSTEAIITSINNRASNYNESTTESSTIETTTQAQNQTLSLNTTTDLPVNTSTELPVNTTTELQVNTSTDLPVITPSTNNITANTSRIKDICGDNTTDPLKLKGGPIQADKMKCTVEIKTKTSYISQDVDCKDLMKYSKTPEPEKIPQSSILPSRSKLKSWLSNPPWWLSMFIVV